MSSFTTIQGLLGSIENRFLGLQNRSAVQNPPQRVVKEQAEEAKNQLRVLENVGRMLSASNKSGKENYDRVQGFDVEMRGTSARFPQQQVQQTLRTLTNDAHTIRHLEQYRTRLKERVSTLEGQIAERLVNEESSFSWKTAGTAVACVAAACLAYAFSNGSLPQVSLPTDGYFSG